MLLGAFSGAQAVVANGQSDGQYFGDF